MVRTRLFWADAAFAFPEDPHMPATATIAAAEALRLVDLITPTEHGIASRVLAKNAGGRPREEERSTSGARGG